MVDKGRKHSGRWSISSQGPFQFASEIEQFDLPFPEDMENLLE